MRRSLFALLFLAVGGLLAAPAASPATAPARDYDNEAAALRKKLPDNFTVLVEKPFLVAGDGSAESVKASATHTVKWAVEHLKKDFFAKDPDELITVYLFKDADSYTKNAKKLFNDTPSTPYGYYSSTHNALVMNIATGGGTLVHEIVHPYIAANFPDCPPWFNEGMGSLFEQSSEKDGHIVGLTNWRLAGLQKAIKADKLPPFKELFAMDSDDFYNNDRGNNYAQSRYLLYYLQENTLLRDYYKAFLKNQKTDPTGYTTLQEILKEKDLPAFQKRWQKWVLDLHFP